MQGRSISDALDEWTVRWLPTSGVMPEWGPVALRLAELQEHCVPRALPGLTPEQAKRLSNSWQKAKVLPSSMCCSDVLWQIALCHPKWSWDQRNCFFPKGCFTLLFSFF